MNDMVDYIAAFFLYHNDTVQRTYLSFLEEAQSGGQLSDTVKFIALHSTVKLTSNALHYRVTPPTFLHGFTTLLQYFVQGLAGLSSLEEEDVFALEENSDDESMEKSPSHQASEAQIDQILLTLEVIGMLLTEETSFVQHFEPRLLQSLVSPLLPMEVVELALWLLQRTILLLMLKEGSTEERPLYLLIELLQDQSLSAPLQERVCYATAELMYSSGEHPNIKEHFRVLNGLNLLLHHVRDGKDANLCYAALYAFGEAVTDCESNKAFVSEEIGFQELSRMIQSSAVTLDVPLFEIFLETATKGSLRLVLDEGHDSPVTHSSTVSSIIMNILSPQPLCNNEQIPRFRTLRTVVPVAEMNMASLEKAEEAAGNWLNNSQQLNESSSGGASSEEDSTFIIHNESHSSKHFSTRWYKGHRLRQSFGGLSVEDANSIEWTDNTNSFTDTDSDRVSLLPNLVGMKIRNTDAILMLIRLLPSSSLDAQSEVLRLLMALLESNPHNKALIHAADQFSAILLLGEDAPVQVRHDYFHLAALLGSYSISQEDSKTLLESAKYCEDPAVQMEFLFVIHRITQRPNPPNFFHFGEDGGTLQVGLVDRFPSSRTGYSFACWMRIDLFRSNEVGLLTWTDQAGNVLFDLYFKKFTYENNVERYCLAVRTQNIPMASEHFCFDSYVFTEASPWHHLTFVHVKQDVMLYINGTLVEKNSSLNYPRTVSKDHAMKVRIGYHLTEDKVDGYFCGSIASLRFISGALDATAVQQLYAYGSAEDASVAMTSAGQKEFLVVDPSSVVYDHPAHTIPHAEDTSVLLCTSPGKQPQHSRMSLQHHMCHGDVTLHRTTSFKQCAREVDAFRYCLEMMSVGQNQQVAALSVICLLLRKNQPLRQAFQAMGSYHILYYLLKQFDAPMEIFDILLDILCDGDIADQQFTFIDQESAVLIFDLLAHVPSGVHKRVLSHIDQMLVRNKENTSFLLEHVGILPMLGLSQSLSPAEGTPLFHIIARMLRGLHGAQQSNLVIGYILAASENTDPDTAFSLALPRKSETEERKAKVFHHFQVAVASSLPLVERLSNFHAAFTFLQSPYESIRLIAIHLLGVLLDSSSQHRLFTFRNQILGFRRMEQILSSFPVTIATCAQLLDLSIGTFQFVSDTLTSKNYKNVNLSPRRSWTNVRSGSKYAMTLHGAQRNIVYPEILQVLFGILKESGNAAAKIQTLTNMEQLLDMDENKEQLWKQSWLDWCALFMTNQPHDADTRALMDNIIQKMMLYELALPKSNRFLALKDMAENEPFQIHILEVLIEYFDERPCLPTFQASEIMRSLSLLYKNIEHISGAGIVCMKVLSHINLLAYQNTSDTRAQMKAHGLFDVRDNLIFHLLRGISEQDTIHFINTFSFHSIANQPKFRDNKGIAYLMQWFHANLPSSSSSSYELTLYIYRILYSVFGPIGENRKIISRILDDPMVCTASSLLISRHSPHPPSTCPDFAITTCSR